MSRHLLAKSEKKRYNAGIANKTNIAKTNLELYLILNNFMSINRKH